MTKVLEALRAIVISVEVVWILVVIWVLNDYPFWLSATGTALKDVGNQVFVPLSGASLGMLAYTYTLSNAVLRPGGLNAQTLRGWHDYWKLRLKVAVTLIYSVAGMLALFVGWVLVNAGQYVEGAAFSVAGFGVSGISLATIAYAKLRARDIVEGLP